MESKLCIKIESNKSNFNEYIVKDINDIIIGRFIIVELNIESRKCDVKLNFYRGNKHDLLRDTLKLLLRTIFKDGKIHKVNIIVYEDINFEAFLEQGFVLEGVFSQNEYSKGHYIDEISFGITRDDYNSCERFSLVELYGENITLRNFTPGDAEKLLDYYIRNKKHLAPFEPIRDSSFFTLENQISLLNESYKQLLNGTSIDMGIFKDDRLIGKLKLSNIVYGSLKSGILGYSIDEKEQGHGYMRESVNLFLEYAFEECNLHRIEASAMVDNEKSRNVLSKCGFKLVGINEKYLIINGAWRDHATYYITKEDFYNK
ncbi:GNAT family protein [Clostridium sp. SM-530-WT-3G]|uniref:GNAT family N-acetyltransferase n=1 Tax=Clostridium sp. SM-530-WT-3G TaxID=2725303 RepID=UPI00145FCB58|nr:GNAT family protein [Clostridium sp. SM-530-WT-3G]NME83928.1 GNAT family N-acetyltransferase [Clostridium sp. SM-530-WT-3G]